MLIGLPLMFLYEVSITISARVLKNRLKKIDKELAKSQKERTGDIKNLLINPSASHPTS